MPTDTAHGWTSAHSFTLRAAAWSLGLFGLLRLSWVETHGLLPLTQLQGRLAAALCGTPALPIDATLACSAADVLALCVGAIVAYPARWRLRLAGAGAGLTVVLGLNTLRIGTLGRVAASPAWFEALHIYVWPAALTLAVAGYVFGWMRFAGGNEGVGSRVRESATTPTPVSSPARLTPRFIFLSAAFLILFTAASPLYLENAGVLAVAAFIARVAAAALHVFGVEARAAANVLWTTRGGFMVTQECISTPLIPIYVAAVVAYASTWRRRALGLVATAPLFVGLGIARLLVVALPAALVASPAFLVHAFYQLVLAAVVVSAAAFWRHGTGGTAVRRALMGMALGVAVAHLLGAPYANVLTRAAEMIGGAPSGFAAGTPLDDPQGAITLLPAFQVGLYMALWVAAFGAVGWRRFLIGLALLELIQVASLVALHVLASHSGLTPHVRDVRAWAVVGPLLVVVAMVNLDWLRRRPTLVGRAVGGADVQERNATYRTFWNHVGAEFPDLGGAASTTFYLENEKRLLGRHLSTLAGKRVLKTDLWDEARNTRILQWIQRQGAEVVGVDISTPVVRMAGAEFAGAPLAAATADVRALPFSDASFDAVYSMGTIEHFPETEAAVRELYRVLKPGGRAIVGVPNRHDPFLRPLMVTILYRLGLYGYGYEKSYSRRTLRQMLEAAGFIVTGDDGILFIPGWLRMLDLLCHTRYPSAARLTAAGVRVFGWIDAHVPAVRRHGYLVAAIGERPAEAARRATSAPSVASGP